MNVKYIKGVQRVYTQLYEFVRANRNHWCNSFQCGYIAQCMYGFAECSGASIFYSQRKFPIIVFGADLTPLQPGIINALPVTTCTFPVP